MSVDSFDKSVISRSALDSFDGASSEPSVAARSALDSFDAPTSEDAEKAGTAWTAEEPEVTSAVSAATTEALTEYHVEPKAETRHEERAPAWWLQEGRAFPPEFADSDDPSCFSFRSLRPQRDGTYKYGDVLVTAEEAKAMRARFDLEYPILPGFEEAFEYKNFTRKATTRDAVWVFARPVPLDLPSPYNKDRLRIDHYGNVISRCAHLGSFLYFDVDHDFPRARGGATEVSNLSAVFWYANQHVKKDQIIAANEDDSFWTRMRCGVTAADLREIVTTFSRSSDQLRILDLLEGPAPMPIRLWNTTKKSRIETLLDATDDWVMRLRNLWRSAQDADRPDDP